MNSRNTHRSLHHLFMLIFSILSLLCSVRASAQTASKEDAVECSVVLNNLKEKRKNIDVAIESMDSLLKSKGSVEVPLAVLLQVNLSDEKSVAQKKSELVGGTQPQEVLKLSEYDSYKKCVTSKSEKSLLSELIERQAHLNTMSLSFLNLERSTQESLIAAFQLARQQYVDRQQIEKQLSDSKESLERAQAKLIKSEKDVSQDEYAADEKLMSAVSLLERFVVDVETEHIKFIDNIKAARDRLKDLSVELSRHVKIDVSLTDIDAEFIAIDDIWKDAAESLLVTFTKIDISSKYSVPNLLETPANAKDQKVYDEYLSLYDKTKKRITELSDQKHSLLLDTKALNFRLVSDSGRLRAKLIGLCDATEKCEDVGSFSERSITGILMELRILPLKFLAGGFNKIVEFKEKINRGFDGWVDVSRQIFIFLILLLLPFLVHRFLNWFSFQLNNFREKILEHSIMNYRRRTHLGLWISRLNPFVPSIGMILAIRIARNLIETTDLQEISYLIFYLEIYFVYRATRLLLKILMELLFSSESLSRINDLSTRAEISAGSLSRFFFGRYVVLHIVEDTVRRGLVFGIAHEVLTWVSFIVVLNEIRHWQLEILQSFEARFPQLWGKVKPFTEGYLRFIIFPPLLALVIGHDAIKVVSRRLIQFDFVKRLVSEVFRKKLQQDSVLSDSLKVPDSSYFALFDYYLPAQKEFYIDRDALMAEKVLQTVSGWLQDNSVENLVVLVGNRGIGKTTSAKMIFEKIPSENKVFKWVGPKIYNSEQLFQWLSSLLNSDIHSVEDFIKVESSLQNKMVLVVDDIHNLFIGKIGGFEAYRLFMELIGLRTTKIFWCLTANSHAWAYLEGVFGKEHFYGQVFEMRMWTDVEIQNLIIARHKVTGYSRSFDKSISAYGTGNVLGEQVETQFFRLLWGQSRGNPRSALMYWISAAAQTSEKEIHIGVPKFINSGVVGAMSNEALIALASISRHDSLTIEELTEVTRIDSFVIRKVVKESIKKELLWMDDQHRVRISSRAQNTIDYYLLGKNFLYE